MAEKSTKKAVIQSGGKQYFVSEGETLEVELLTDASLSTGSEPRSHTFEALLVIDGEVTKVGTPVVDGAKVTTEITEPLVKDDKVVAIRYKAKKRVHKTKGHRQRKTQIKITKIG